MKRFFAVLLSSLLYSPLLAGMQVFDSLTPGTGLFKAKFSSNAQKLALYTVTQDIKLIDMSFFDEIGSLSYSSEIFDIDLSENGNVLLVCEYPGSQTTDCRYYQTDRDEPVLEFRLNEKITYPKISYDGRYFFAVSEGKNLKIFDAVESLDVSSIEVSAAITSYDFSDDLRWILIGTINGYYHLWDTKMGYTAIEDDFHESIHKVVLGKNHALLTGRFKDDCVLSLNTLSISKLPNNKNLGKKLPSQVVSAAFHPTLDHIIAIARPADLVELWDHTDQKLIKSVKVPMLKKDKFKRPTPLALKWDSLGALVGVTSQGEVFKINFKELL